MKGKWGDPIHMAGRLFHGGMGSLFYLRSFKEDVDGVLLISPFMGWDAILGQIDPAGSTGHWNPKRTVTTGNIKTKAVGTEVVC